MVQPLEAELAMRHREELAHLLITKSYREGDFTLASGKKSDYYFDCRVTALDARGSYLLGTLFADDILRISPDIRGVGGLELGACPLISATTAMSSINGSNLCGLIVRKQPKDHGTGKVIEGMENFQPGDKIVVLEDVVTTGGSAIKAAKRIQEANLDVAAIYTILDREEGGRPNIEDAGFTFYSMFTRRELKMYNGMWESHNG